MIKRFRSSPGPLSISTAPISEQASDRVFGVIGKERKQEGIHQERYLQALHLIFLEPTKTGFHFQFYLVKTEGLFNLHTSGKSLHLSPPLLIIFLFFIV